VVTGLEEAAQAAAVLAVRRDPGARDAVEKCRRSLEEVQEHGQRSALLLGWAYLALDEPADAWELFRAAIAYDTEPELTGRAALLGGLIMFRFGEPAVGLSGWHRAADQVAAVLDEVDFTRDLTGQITDELVWPELAEVRAGEPVLPRLLAGFDAEIRSRTALGLYALHFSLRDHEPAARATIQVVAIEHSGFVGAAWLALAEILVSGGDKPAATQACHRAIESAAAGQLPASALLGFADGPVADVPTHAKTLLGVLQRDAGDIEGSLAILADAARDGDPEAVYALAQSHLQAGDHSAARAAYQRAAERPSSVQEDAIFNLGLLAKQQRDLTEARWWFGQYIDAGWSAAPLAAAHLGELCYWLGDKEGALHWYEYTLGHTEVAELVEEAEQRMAELLESDGVSGPGS
jgi:tetratricopeptide (TPR) repeat protein